MYDVGDWRDAEINAAHFLRTLGYSDARLTAAGSDGGIDVRATGALAQVKHLNRAAGRPDVQRLVGAQALDTDARLFFFSRSGYAAPALAYADQMGVALFRYDDLGVMTATNHTAVRVVRNRQRILSEGSSRTSSSVSTTGQRKAPDLDDVATLAGAWSARREADISGHGEGVRSLWMLLPLAPVAVGVWAVWRAFTVDELGHPYWRVFMGCWFAAWLLANVYNARDRKYARSDAARALKEVKGIDVRTGAGETHALELVRQAARRIPGVGPALVEGDTRGVAEQLRRARPALKGTAVVVARALTKSAGSTRPRLVAEPLEEVVEPQLVVEQRKHARSAIRVEERSTGLVEEPSLPTFDELFDQVAIIIPRDEIESVSCDRTLSILKQGLSSRAAAVINKQRYSIAVHGYDADPRELWEIAEVRQFFHALDDAFPYWLWFLDQSNSFFSVIMLCHVDVERIEAGRVKYSESQVQELLVDWWIPKLLAVSEFAMADEAEVDELVEAAFNYVRS